jgi:hypothetical protein
LEINFNGENKLMTIETLIQENKRIEELAKQTAKENGLPENNIIWDGIYEKYLEKYIETNPHILWILKEAPETNGVYGWHIGDITEDNQALKNKNGTLRQICLISYAILRECSYDDACKASIKDLVDARQRVAHINVCKIKTTPGKYSEADLTDEYDRWKDILDAQIKAFQPEIIICGNTLQYFSNDNNYFGTTRSEKKLLESIIPNPSQKFCYYSENDRLFINIHHPSDFNVDWKKCINEIVNVVLQWRANKK